ncbi:MAG: hypothetical protein V4582_21355 [Pseudomonadota bacterium]
MNDTVLETPLDQASQGRRQAPRADAPLILNEIDAIAVIDAPPDPAAPCDLLSFGNMRETCPACGDAHLKLVLRQEHVRAAHLFCPRCERCYDARYSDGSSAFSL